MPPEGSRGYVPAVLGTLGGGAIGFGLGYVMDATGAIAASLSMILFVAGGVLGCWFALSSRGHDAAARTAIVLAPLLVAALFATAFGIWFVWGFFPLLGAALAVFAAVGARAAALFWEVRPLMRSLGRRSARPDPPPWEGESSGSAR